MGGVFGELGRGSGKLALGLFEGSRLGGALRLNALQLLAEHILPGFESVKGCGLLAEFELEAADGLTLLADFGELARGLGLQLLDRQLEPASSHREFGA